MICALVATDALSFSENIGVWVAVAILLIPAIKVVIDWVRPPQIRPQPLSVKMEERFATKDELAKLEKDLQAQMKDMRSYVHEEIHKVRNDIEANNQRAHMDRSGIHERINSLVIVTYKNHGLLEGMSDRIGALSRRQEHQDH